MMFLQIIVGVGKLLCFLSSANIFVCPIANAVLCLQPRQHVKKYLNVENITLEGARQGCILRKGKKNSSKIKITLHLNV